MSGSPASDVNLSRSLKPGMSIRRLLYLMLAVLAVLTLGLSVREFVDIRAKQNTVTWLQQTNAVSEQAQQLGGLLARERGLTALLLSRGSMAQPDELIRLTDLRRRVDDNHAVLIELIGGLANRMQDGTGTITAPLLEIEKHRTLLAQTRRAVDLTLSDGPAEISVVAWIRQLSGHIVTLQNTIDLHIAPLEQALDARVSQPMIKGVLFTLNELLGQERALISAVLARTGNFEATEMRELQQLRANILRVWSRADTLLQATPSDPELDQHIRQFWSDLARHHEEHRQRILNHHEQQVSPPLTAMQWFDQSSASINGALSLSTLISERIDADIAQMRHTLHIRAMLFTLALLIVLSVLALAFVTLRQRILAPLAQLENAARAISTGDLSPQLPPPARDELGHLTRAFEHMRTSLQASQSERERNLVEMRKLNTAIEQSLSSVIITDTEGFIEYTNPQFTRTSGYLPEEMRGRHVSILKSGDTPTAHYAGLWDALKAGQAWKGELLNRGKNNQSYWEAVTISPICDADGRITHLISIQHDIDEHKRTREHLRFISSYDALTHLANRSLLTERFEQARENARRSDTQIALVMLGVRRFKRINDSLGHEVGDQLLCELAARLSRSIGEHDTASRITGSEFAVLLTGMNPNDRIIDRVKQILETVGRPAHIGQNILQLSVHAGISLLPGDGDNLDQLLACAGLALHEAERESTDSLLFYTHSQSLDVQENLRMENDLRRALAESQLSLHYQPKVDLVTGRIIGAEALARWRNTQTGQFVPPDRFIAVAEETGLIHPLGEWVMNEACRQLAQWRQQGLPHMPVAINLSAVQLQQQELPELIRRTLDAHKLDASSLEIELTESAVMDNPEEATVALRLLKALGLRIAIDDFGTGYSSFAYLNRFPVDVLKVDRSFVDGLTHDHSAGAIVSSVIALAHRIGLRVVAEGVETAEQLEKLREQDCDEIQGYYFSRPLPADEFARMLETGKHLSAAVTPGPEPSRLTER